jgi:alpha-tubulin suppressor-like RCC1 family protein
MSLMKYVTGVHFDLDKRAGFALPTVLIASIVMLTVLLVAITSTSAIDVSLRAQSYDQIAQSASEAGLAYAKECLEANNGIPQWSDDKPLKPDTDCSGNQLGGCAVEDPPLAACHFVAINDSDGDGVNNSSSTFSVGLPNVKLIGLKQVETGNSHACATTYDSQIYCWGKNTYARLGIGSDTPSQSNVPMAVVNSGVLSGKSIISISSGTTHTCVVASDRKAYCWGQNNNGQLGDGGASGYQSAVPVAVDTTGSLSGKSLLSIAAGEYFTCALASDSQVYCWGDNDYGALGNNNLDVDSSTPVPVNTTNGTSSLFGKSVVSIASGGAHVCAVATDGSAHCWGWNDKGQLGNNSTVDSPVPVAVATDVASSLNGKFVMAIVTGEQHTCAIDSASNAHCWGYNNYGQLGNNTSGSGQDKLKPVAVSTSSPSVLTSGSVLSITAGGNHTCVIATDNKAYCWGLNDNGQLGNDSKTNKSVAVAVLSTGNMISNKTILNISTGDQYTCVIASDAQVYCWGLNDNGQLGNDSTSERRTPVAVKTTSVVGGKATDIVSTGRTNLLRKSDGLSWRQYERKGLTTRFERPWKQIGSGSHHSCALTLDGQVYCWGRNHLGQLGWGNVEINENPHPTPGLVDTTDMGGLSVKSLAIGYSHTCVLASDSWVYCWGSDDRGQLGNGAEGSKTRPYPISAGVIGSQKLLAVTAGSDHTCALAADHNAYCWGWNGYGQLGDNSTTNRQTPVAVYTGGVLSGKKVVSLVSNSTSIHTCAIASDGLAYCWGGNGNNPGDPPATQYYGQLGNNSTAYYNDEPVAVVGDLASKAVLSIATAGYHTCAIAVDSGVYCWGAGYSGQLGNGSTGNLLKPTGDIKNSGALNGKITISITGGRDFTCAIASDSGVYCWGLNDYGQLGDNTVGHPANDKSVPVKIYDTGTLANKTPVMLGGGAETACAIAYNNQAYCWGKDNRGQLGDGVTPPPTYVERPVGVLATPYRSSVYF